MFPQRQDAIAGNPVSEDIPTEALPASTTLEGPFTAIMYGPKPYVDSALRYIIFVLTNVSHKMAMKSSQILQ